MAVELGGARVHVLSEGTFALDGGAVFGVVPRALWAKSCPPDESNRVTMGLNPVLIEAAGQRILVDTGLGEGWSEKQARIYRIDRPTPLAASLRRLGLTPEDIDIVVNTHLHFDHTGGNTTVVDGKPTPAFPKARYVVQQGEWDDASHPNELNRGSYVAERFVPVAEAGQLETVEGETEIVPGVRLIPVGGHTAHHQMVLVEGERHALVLPTDVLPMTCHLSLPYITGYDVSPVTTLEVKKRLLSRAVEEGWRVVFYHDPRSPVGMVRAEGGRYIFCEVEA